MKRIVAGCMVALAVVASPAEAQSRAAFTASAPAGPAADSRGAFVVEAAGGALGALAGIGAVLLTSRCDVEDLGCGIISIGSAGLVGVIGATAGTTLAARGTGSRSSIGGAIAGSVLGTGVSLGVHYLLNRNSDRNVGDAITLPIFVIGQGVGAALGSRVIGAARGMR
ncbi:MAG TPA: hypothetical protein VFO55_12230 [Gemmatimonadaceae bacterium]|nr:hypothetical protein [Gemmatimonadaceae bacterium]